MIKLHFLIVMFQEPLLQTPRHFSDSSGSLYSAKWPVQKEKQNCPNFIKQKMKKIVLKLLQLLSRCWGELNG